VRVTYDGTTEVWAKCPCQRVMRYSKSLLDEDTGVYYPKQTSSGQAGNIRCDCGKTFSFIKKEEEMKPSQEMKPSSEKQPECIKCGSKQINVYRKGFGLGKAAGGLLLLGPVGLLGGLIGSKKLQFVCINCGHKWLPFDN
jgi:hypothetical protein